ncbi:MAG: carbohydrate-binding protein [Bacteroidales bacterium]
MRLNFKIRLLFIASILLFPVSGHTQNWNVNSDRWTATDGLGRKLPDQAETGTPKKDKYIAMFYWTWHTDGNATFSPVMNITQILKQYPEAATDANHPAWQGISPGVFWWDEPLFGYYRTTDAWILRKHAEMLADAGVDVVFFDCTNGSLTWKSSYTVLLRVWDQARKDGVKTPQIAFLLPFGVNTNSLVSLYELYSDLYHPQLYKDLWFMWNGKPLVMAYPESLVAQSGGDAGMKFTATAPFYAINATCPSWSNNIGNLTFRLYKWNTNYSQSVSGTPISEKTFVNFNDNEKLKLTFDQQEAGEYVWVLSNGTEQVGVWKWTDSNDPVISYFSGIQVAGNYESEISYNPEFNFTALTSGTNHTPVAVVGSIDQQAVNSMKEFFTFRPGQPDYVNGPTRNDQWGWLENYPQHGYAPKAGGGFEQATVGVAQNASDASGGHASGFNTPLTYGRSYTKSAGQDTRPEAYLKGLNFQEQWSGASALDPDLIFVTGWNEWIAGRWFDWDVKPFAFVDEYSAEKSRDLEPVKSWGNKGDVYYMQLISNVRRFKGMLSQDTVSAAKTIDMENTGSWADVRPEYLSYKGNVLHRNHAGQGSDLMYTNTTGRNDIVSAKVARDANFIYFYVETADNLTDKTDPKWMRLFIDIDRNKSTGWEGYDFIVNRLNPEDSVLVEKSQNSWSWETAGKAGYVVKGKTLVVKIKRSVLGIGDGQVINFEFKWSDNMQEDGNIMDFYVNGDVAPGARFNYVHKVDWSDDRFRYAQFPEDINHGLKCDHYEGVFDTIPSFFDLKITKTDFPATFVIRDTTTKNFGLKYTGFIDVPTKDAYTFTLNTDLSAKLFIGSNLVVKSENAQGEQSGTIKLMPGKHAISVEYITKEANSRLLNILIESSALARNTIPSSMLFKYNQSPSISLVFNGIQKYFSPVDSVIIVKASDTDGSITKIELYDNEQFIGEETSTDFVIRNLEVGEHSIFARVTDNDGAVTESNMLSFIVKSPFPIPGTIKTEEYRSGKNVAIINSTDYDGGLSIRVAYGWTDYPVDVPVTGVYHFTFRVPSATGTKKILIKANNIEVGSVEVGNTGTSQPWFDVTIDVSLISGIQLLHFDFKSIITLHKIDISYLGSGIESELDRAIMVTPNPSSDDFLVQTRKPSASIVVYDLLGNVADQSALKMENFTRRIGSNLRPGIYLLVVTGEDGAKQTIKIIKN